ncbi:2959_t:CDS:10 [Paraglomus brasilianum]|uniref:2959_t:CDS:1 n=1 Tax=Paraglomus brasilianum TaxID=144538 RepID=A0A9N8WAW0_9GLOM|nr:2959_t:CDS:10 [Paraglomus brasilianum]
MYTLLRASMLFSSSNRYYAKGNFIRSYSSTVGKPLFDKILIANRGEIACRVIRTAKRLGVKTVCVYSEADRNALHTKLSDEAYLIGPAPSSESYLNIDKIIEVARRSGAQAIHPGYGFLSENPTFASRLAEEKIIFIGPPASAMISMGSKRYLFEIASMVCDIPLMSTPFCFQLIAQPSLIIPKSTSFPSHIISESKEIMTAAGVPVVPGYHGANQEISFLKSKSLEIGYPILIKAIKGGGGKGMRIVYDPSDFELQLNSSKREAMNSFSDDQVLLEKYLLTPRHVEVQIFADTYNNVVHLFERDCSIQRRHQKILEEAPAPMLDEAIRNELGRKAVAAARAVGYVGAGTVEFIMDTTDGKFYFMEMNTRLQVEHPVTEMVTGTDLVQWQFEVAAGNSLPLSQDQIQLDGHAFEARIYAENPTNNFLPDTGTLLHLRTPQPSTTVRIETGFDQGDQVNVYYDPMIAKLVVKGGDRAEALRALRNALDDYEVVGLNTNIEFLKQVASHSAFVDGQVETGFIEKHREDLFQSDPNIPPELIAQASLSIVLCELGKIQNQASNSLDPFSPWSYLSSTRLNSTHTRQIILGDNNNTEFNTYITFNKDGSYDITIMSALTDPAIFNKVTATWNETEREIIANIGDRRFKSHVVFDKQQKVVIFGEGLRTVLMIPEPNYLQETGSDTAGSVKTPMPCRVSQILVESGQTVEKGTPLIVLEAMKMEHLIKSPVTGTIDKIYYKVGDLVEENKNLLGFVEN